MASDTPKYGQEAPKKYRKAKKWKEISTRIISFPSLCYTHGLAYGLGRILGFPMCEGASASKHLHVWLPAGTTQIGGSSALAFQTFRSPDEVSSSPSRAPFSARRLASSAVAFTRARPEPIDGEASILSVRWLQQPRGPSAVSTPSSGDATK